MNDKVDKRVEELMLFAWVGEDELGSGEVGLKQGLLPIGLIPLVAVRKDRMMGQGIPEGLQLQSNNYGKTIQLCEFKFVRVVETLNPQGVA